MDINDPAQSPFENVEHIGVALKGAGDNQNHIGILYKPTTTSPALLLHLAWHHVLLNENVSGKVGYLWLNSGLDPINKAALSAFCALVVKVNGNSSIPYGLDLTGKCFDPVSATWQPPTSTVGLTCASFIVEIFAAQGHILLDLSSWEVREDDTVWQQHILGLLKEKLGTNHPHIEAQIEQIGSIRIRPEEVGASVSQESIPVDFTDCVSLSQEIITALNLHSSQ